MIISHSKQKCFWKITRTGSTNIEVVLRLTAGLDLSQDVVAATDFFPSSANIVGLPVSPSGVSSNRRAHMTPQTAIDNGLLTQAQYDTYDHYCMVRDPIDRFISSYHLAIPRYDFNIKVILEETIKPNTTMAMWRKQSEYLTLGNVTTLPFSDYANSANTIFTAFGAPIPDQLPNISRSHLRYETFTKEEVLVVGQRAMIETYYADDMLLNF